MKTRGCTGSVVLYAFIGVCASGQTLWREPKPATIADWTWGPGGQEMVPQPPFQFVKENFGGTNPKVEVRDAAGHTWTVKFGSEVKSDTFAARLLNAVGYAAEIDFFVASGTISGVHDLKRAKHFVSKNGSFQNARFKLHHHGDGSAENRAWSWVDNPFVGSHQLNGLKILVMLTSNWDTKDSREGESSNNEIIHPALASNSTAWYAVTDWGASFGKTGGFFTRDRWDWIAYHAQTPKFVRLVADGKLDWGFQGKHGRDISAGVGLDDVRWLLPYLSRITIKDLEAGLTASGASVPVAEVFARCLRDRIAQLQSVAQSSNVQQAAK